MSIAVHRSPNKLCRSNSIFKLWWATKRSKDRNVYFQIVLRYFRTAHPNLFPPIMTKITSIVFPNSVLPLKTSWIFGTLKTGQDEETWTNGHSIWKDGGRNLVILLFK
jgi:hypothetical protein